MNDSHAISPTPEPPPSERITLEITPTALPEQSLRDLRANATLSRISEAELLARLIHKKLGGVFTVRAA